MALLAWRVNGNHAFNLKPEQKYLLVTLAYEAGKPIPVLIAQAFVG